MPVVMVSSLTENGCATTLRALELGAVDFVTKPKIDVARGTLDLADSIVEKVRAAARARIRRPHPHSTPSVGKVSVNAQGRASVGRMAINAHAMLKTTQNVIAIGASTGGTEAIRDILVRLPPDAPPIVIVQHMPPGFTRAFAARLDSISALQVKEAEDGDRVFQGRVLIAPGDRHMVLARSGADYSVRVMLSERVNHHRPSVDVLFDSCARVGGANVVGVLLTGMGNDGANGLLRMRKAGAATIAQDEASCIVFGMPHEAIELGAAARILPLSQMAHAILQI